VAALPWEPERAYSFIQHASRKLVFLVGGKQVAEVPGGSMLLSYSVAYGRFAASYARYGHDACEFPSMNLALGYLPVETGVLDAIVLSEPGWFRPAQKFLFERMAFS